MEGRETGIVKWFDSKKGYGFIERDFGGDIFVHYSSLKGEGFRKLEEGQKVEYIAEEKSKNKGPQAFELVILEEAPGSETENDAETDNEEEIKDESGVEEESEEVSDEENEEESEE
ncbi:MAG: cold-shock protein [Calditrichia bacterium]|nr:cold-shock protein [Calditrichia bacterium]